MSKRQRDFGASFEAPLKNPREQFIYVNPFELMMQAARNRTQQSLGLPPGPNPAQGPNPAPAPVPQPCTTIPCMHCGQQLPESHLRQCDQCQDVFCAMCSVANYDERDDRVFCLECDQDKEGGGRAQLGGGSMCPWTPAKSGMLGACGHSPHLAALGRSPGLRGTLGTPFGSHPASSPFVQANSSHNLAAGSPFVMPFGVM